MSRDLVVLLDDNVKTYIWNNYNICGNKTYQMSDLVNMLYTKAGIEQNIVENKNNSSGCWTRQNKPRRYHHAKTIQPDKQDNYHGKTNNDFPIDQ